MNLKDGYILTNCCNPGPDDKIVGYYSFDNIVKVHRHDCPNLDKADETRLVALEWADILGEEDFVPGDDFQTISDDEFRILRHHLEMGVDYSLKVARVLNVDRQKVFDCHTRLRELGLLERVKPLIIQYRKNIVKNKWIKHRNHTYYDLTDKGRAYITYYNNEK